MILIQDIREVTYCIMHTSDNIITLIEQILPKTESGVLITDVGSVKNDICVSVDCFQMQCGDL